MIIIDKVHLVNISLISEASFDISILFIDIFPDFKLMVSTEMKKKNCVKSLRLQKVHFIFTYINILVIVYWTKLFSQKLDVNYFKRKRFVLNLN